MEFNFLRIDTSDICVDVCILPGSGRVFLFQFVQPCRIACQVKLGGRAAAERLAASHPEGAVRNLAMLPLGDAGETGGGRGVLVR